ncbi:hypothetical protein GCM10027449_16430 [Sinomonas notoginsengisoli]|uniref:ATP-binding protein n=1 Tax=Sinomonas notoginsengisoli TaxID=1457311 RepID=UPI001F31D51C|nr:LuxR C-terminal-related transcriptional regulator [Sinomonas notoginsengisoli]
MTTAAAPPAPRARVPAPASSFVGREAELAELAGRLASGRLVTLTGPGGAGKTRLAVEAVRLDPLLAADAVFVDLTRVGARAAVACATAEAAGLRVPEDAALDALVWSLDGGGPALIVLDNVEHVLDETAAFVAHLLEEAPTARVLATSRRPLRVSGEEVMPVGPMDDEDAQRLFWERARSVRPSLPDAPESRAAARDLCARLDRLPLGLELAAARMTVLTPAEMLPLLERPFPVLASGSAAVPERHRSLHACIASSVDTLGDRERAVFEAFAVFASPFGTQAASAVAGATLEDLEDLVGRSLVHAGVDGSGGTVFRLLETLRDYAREGLESSGRLRDARRRHLDWLLAEFGADQVPTMLEATTRARAGDRLLPDLRAALDYAAEADPAAGLRLFSASRDIWFRRAQSEGLARVNALLERHPDPDESRAGALVAAEVLHNAFQETDAVELCAAEALAIFAEGSLPTGTALHFQAVGRFLAGHFAEAQEAARASYRVFVEHGDVAGQSRALGSVGTAAVAAGEYAEALPVLARALSLAEAGGDVWSQGQLLTYTGLAETSLGRVADGRASLLRAVDRFARIGDISLQGIALARLAALAVRKAPATAVRAAAAASRREGAGGKYHSITRADFDEVRTAAERLLGRKAMREAWEAGERLTFAEAAAALSALDGGASTTGGLSPREQEVAEMVRRGHTNASIAVRLGLSERTVEHHVAHILAKLGLRNRASLAGWVARRGQDADG